MDSPARFGSSRSPRSPRKYYLLRITIFCIFVNLKNKLTELQMSVREKDKVYAVIAILNWLDRDRDSQQLLEEYNTNGFSKSLAQQCNALWKEIGHNFSIMNYKNFRLKTESEFVTEYGKDFRWGSTLKAGWDSDMDELIGKKFYDMSIVKVEQLTSYFVIHLHNGHYWSISADMVVKI